MKLAVSNIAWPRGEDAGAAEVLARHGVTGVELAPTLVWPDPLAVTERDAVACRLAWERRGRTVVAMQALLFGKSDLLLFGDPAVRDRAVGYLGGVMRLAGWLGRLVLVFGSPGNRKVGGRAYEEVLPEAVAVFRRLGELALGHGVTFCIEPNPPAYGCDFVTSAAQGAALVAEVAHPGFGLHLDAGGLTLSGERPADLKDAPLAHYHVSEPHLKPIGTAGAPHAVFAADLQARGYDRWCSVEMRQPEGDWRSALESSLMVAREAYGRLP
jgi:sugar phosphate isomerase/epimerase